MVEAAKKKNGHFVLESQLSGCQDWLSRICDDWTKGMFLARFRVARLNIVKTILEQEFGYIQIIIAHLPQDIDQLAGPKISPQNHGRARVPGHWV